MGGWVLRVSCLPGAGKGLCEELRMGRENEPVGFELLFPANDGHIRECVMVKVTVKTVSQTELASYTNIFIFWGFGTVETLLLQRAPGSANMVLLHSSSLRRICHEISLRCHLMSVHCTSTAAMGIGRAFFFLAAMGPSVPWGERADAFGFVAARKKDEQKNLACRSAARPISCFQ